jgi:hypothetical protein
LWQGNQIRSGHRSTVTNIGDSPLNLIPLSCASIIALETTSRSRTDVWVEYPMQAQLGQFGSGTGPPRKAQFTERDQGIRYAQVAADGFSPNCISMRVRPKVREQIHHRDLGTVASSTRNEGESDRRWLNHCLRISAHRFGIPNRSNVALCDIGSGSNHRKYYPAPVYAPVRTNKTSALR